ncbi:MAG: prepilin-type N-terminal cleavage/methylation domain-containing protein [Puniceicoccales bacterium]|jgi:prepilin-type N-terminal cleavage/methylation domain-containing protein|nr:prepilin-type N-terminal cleavage/methylation domain-containing protein [Puniceicoccales bacterium]
MNSIKNKSAFSLMEILITITLMSVAAGMSVVGFKKIDFDKLGPRDALQKAIRMGKYIARRGKNDVYFMYSHNDKCRELKAINADSAGGAAKESTNLFSASILKKSELKSIQSEKMNEGSAIKNIFENPCFFIVEQLKIVGNDGKPINEFAYEIKDMFDISEGESGQKIDRVSIQKDMAENGSGKIFVEDEEMEKIKISKNGIVQEFKFTYQDDKGVQKTLTVNAFSGEVSEVSKSH